LFSITLSFGLVSELLGVKYGWIYGSYHYPPGAFFFGLVPLMTPVSWAIIIYVALSMTNLLVPKDAGELTRLSPVAPLAVVSLIVVLSSIDGLITVNLDPHVGGWVWTDGGPYYGVPISNFVGWFLVTFSATFIYRTYATLFAERSPNSSYHDYYPVVVYFSYFMIHASLALSIDRPELVLIGVGTMMPLCVIIANKYLRDSTLAYLANTVRRE
jgi:putative membrane protein